MSLTTYISPDLPITDEALLHINSMPLHACYVCLARLISKSPRVLFSSNIRDFLNSEVWYGNLVFCLLTDKVDSIIENFDFIAHVNKTYSNVEVYRTCCQYEDPIDFNTLYETLGSGEV